VIGARIILSADVLEVTGDLKVYDLAGNLVCHRMNDDDLIPPSWHANADGQTRELLFYWNGMTDRGMKSAPGVYRVLLTLKERTTKGSKSNLYKSEIGIRR
jgi:hypothetical protein